MIGAIGLIAAGCGGDDDSTSADTGEETTEAPTTVSPITVTLPFQDSIVWMGYEISKGTDGPFEVNYGLEAETEATEGNSFTVQQLIAGNVDFAITGSVETMIANSRGNELLGIGAIQSDVFTIAATTDSGTTSIEDLKGQALGVTDLGGGEIPLVKAAIAGAGLSEKDVELQVIGAGGAAAKKALENGDVAAAAGAINDFVPLEDAGLEFVQIVGDDFSGLPNDYMVIRPELEDDADGIQNVVNLMKGWYEGTVYGEQFPDDALARICVEVPEDCQDQAFAQGFYDASLAISIDEAKACGAPDIPKLETARDAIAAVDVPEAADVDVAAIFPDTYSDQMCPDQAVIDEFAARTGATG
jgi:NitT/TauT family transport system substrate-binding protein